MGSAKVSIIREEADRKAFAEHLLKDLRALQYMLKYELFEDDVQRMGAEQELYLVDQHWRPAPLSLEVLERLQDADITTEFARFNIEINLSPRLFRGSALSEMANELRRQLQRTEAAAQELDAHILQVGILPTLRRSDLQEHNITPLPRYKMLSEVLHNSRGGMFDLHIKGTDELILEGVHALYEASNTSFQLHYQVPSHDFVAAYNWAQLITAPLLASAVNAPLLLGNRLWQETRIALFQQAIDIRNAAEYLRNRHPRVSFGHDWVRNSVLDIYKEDITRHRSILCTTQQEEPLEMLKAGQTPKLRALSIHNGTVYRWNRACYGVTEGKPHLRIENRVLPAGPTTQDQMANLALWLGLMHGRPEAYDRLHETADFDEVKNNFFRVARYGLDTPLVWPGYQKPVPADVLLREELLPIARAGLQRAEIDEKDRESYLGIIEERVKAGKTGARWQVKAFEKVRKHGSEEEALVAVTAGMFRRQQEDCPVHEWTFPEAEEAGAWQSRYRIVSQIMTKDVFLVHEKDSIALAANIMDWQTIRHILVEDENKKLIGIISVKDFVRWFAEADRRAATPSVREVMSPTPVTVPPNTIIEDALELMHKKNIACLPIVENDKLLGVVSEHDFTKLAMRLLREMRG